jgi:hypothetical protein
MAYKKNIVAEIRKRPHRCHHETDTPRGEEKEVGLASLPRNGVRRDTGIAGGFHLNTRLGIKRRLNDRGCAHNAKVFQIYSMVIGNGFGQLNLVRFYKLATTAGG